MVMASSDTLTFHSTSDVSIIYKLIEMCGFSKTLILTIFGVICRASTECGCKSFGGLCIQDKEGRELTASCNYTSFIGDTFYQSDGYTLVDGCKPESCGVGKCVPTFGGFYCECPPGFYGSFCNFSDPELDKIRADNKYWVYYQVQPKIDGTQHFVVVYDIKNDTLSKGKLVLMIITSDGRQFYPSLIHFSMLNTKRHCLRRAAENPGRHDTRLCDFLPDKKVLTYKINPISTKSMADNYENDLRYISQMEEPVGRSGIITLEIQWRIDDKVHTLYRSVYKTFTYYKTRVEYNCLVDLDFVGCSKVQQWPVKYSRGQEIRFQAIHRDVECRGASPHIIRWALQRNIYTPGQVDNLADRDAGPKPIGAFNNKLKISFRIRELDPGLHMLEAIYHYKGNPPNHGGTAIFLKTSVCWFEVVTGNLTSYASGGMERTASCYRPVTLEFDSSNPSFDARELSFSIKCDRKSDKECEPTPLSVPTYSKTKSDCNVLYTFDVSMWSKYDKRIDHVSNTMKVYLHFIWSDVVMSINCLFNCYPIDPRYSVLVYATTHPYISRKIDWNITVDDEELKRFHTQVVDAFQPLTTSRIIRISGKRFIKSGQTISNVSITASGNNHSFYSRKVTVSNNLRPIMNEFRLEVDKESTEANFFRFARNKKTYEFEYSPVRYTIYQINPDTRVTLILKETNYEWDLKFKPSWEMVQLCVTDGSNTAECNKKQSVPKKRSLNSTVTYAQVKKFCDANDTPSCLATAVVYFSNGVPALTRGTPNAPKRFAYGTRAWTISATQRIAILKLALKTKDLTLPELLSTSQLLTLIFCSASGNYDEGLFKFYDETFGKRDFKAMFDWVEMHRLALSLLANSFEQLQLVTSGREWSHKSARFANSDILDEFIKTWSLAHSQTSFMKKFKDDIDPEYRDYIGAELDFQVRETQRLLGKGLNDFFASMPRFAHVFYGLRHIGIKNVKAWFTRTSYQGLLAALNKSTRHAENEQGYNNYVLEPPRSFFPIYHFIRYTGLQFPNHSEELFNRELTLVVMLALNLPADRMVSPLLFVALFRKNGDQLKELPGSLLYNVTLPKVEDGFRVSTNLRSFTIIEIVDRPDCDSEYYPYVVYKVTLPSRYYSYRELVYFQFQVSLKMKIAYDYLPEFEDVESEIEMKVHRSTHVRLWTGSVGLEPRKGEPYVPQVYYVGILISKKVRELQYGPLIMYVKKDAEICINQAIGSDEEEKCQRAVVDEISDVECTCRQFGVVYAISEAIRREPVLIKRIKLKLPEVQDQPRDYFLIAIITIILLLILIYGTVSDSRRHKANLLLMKDTYPGDRNLIAIGVYTSVRLWSGTSSTVAIKLTGRKSSSRVHLLRSKKRKTLRAGEDDWFVLATKAPLGKIVKIAVWHNFYKLSDWCCSRIYINDFSSGQWYIATVNRWLRIDPHLPSVELKMVTFEATELHSLDGVLISLPYSFSTHLVNEFRDRHHIGCLLFSRKRSLFAHEHGSIILVIKILTIYVGSWFALEVYLAIINGMHLDDESSKLVISLANETLIMALLMALASHPVTLPLGLIYRSLYKSRLLQKKITNPIYLQIVHPRELVTEVKSSEFSSNATKRKRRKEIKETEEQRVGFDLGTEPLRLSRRFTQVISDVVFKKFAWTKKATSKRSWKKAILQIIKPAQFRCVNISHEAFKIKTRKRTAIWRLISALLIAGLFGIVESSFMLTDFGDKLEAASYLVFLALIFDAFIIDPAMIALNSFLMFYILKASNKESYLWNEDTHVEGPKPLSHADYLKTFTKNRIYRPLLSSEIDSKRKKEDAWNVIKAIVYYLCSALAIYCCVYLLEHSYNNSYFCNVRIKSFHLEDLNPQLQRPSFKIDEVYSFERAHDYLATNVADLSLAWYNSRNITDHKERVEDRRWARDYVTKPIGASNFLIIFVSDEGELARIMRMFSKFFSKANGYLSDGKQLTEPMLLGGQLLHCMKSSYGIVMGKSREFYPLRGHNMTLQMVDFRPNYFKLLSLLGHLAASEYRPNARAIVWSTNYINIFARRVITVDSIVEFLPSGVTTASYQIRTFVAYSDDEETVNIYERLLLALLFVHFILTVSSAVKTGMRKYYLRNLEGFTNLIVYLAGFCCWFFKLFKDQLLSIDNLSNLATDTYYDLHHVYETETVLAIVRLSIVIGIITDVVMGVWAASPASSIHWPFAKITHWCLSALAVQLFVGLAANLGKSAFKGKFAVLHLLSHVREESPLAGNHYDTLLTATTIFIFCIFNGTSMAIFIRTRFRTTVTPAPPKRHAGGRLTAPYRRLMASIRRGKIEAIQKKKPTAVDEEEPSLAGSPDRNPIEVRTAKSHQFMFF